MTQPFIMGAADAQAAFPSLTVSSRLGDVGGQKLVFDATHPVHGHVALKVAQPGGSMAQERALREVQAAARLTGSPFPKIYAHGLATVSGESIIYVIEEFLSGGSLRGRLGAQGRLPMADVLNLAECLLDALVVVEAARLVHRDIKPENIMLPPGRVVLIDFGIARHLDLASLTHDFAPFGPLTPGYAAPEQIKNEKGHITIRTDLFALGVVMYEALAGYNPFLVGCRSSAEALQRAMRLNPPKLSSAVPAISGELEDFIHRCLNKAAHRRPPSALDALDEFRQIRTALARS